ncbi:glutamine-hydrolyzing carbamoyl-phosphate synthase small subunit [Prochlorococcus sp. MIT 1307]|uniref:glutamine-hydrolyzing carbamoyl-phosphate synthase small subunit n=1 Tax=Prochlorococcus sp. MIT 1307 TaxID=3096219 RepID=UPI002A74B386|nr:glutamine-hydrolyzing carbamoyl-phosphate synthase small subunit [Prochlorococcus sp. MIT 1307]
MPSLSANPAFLVLADGTLFEGNSFGSRGLALGEVVFNTGMTGYQEVLTDPSYFGQLVTFTYPEIGNTGVNSEDQEALHPSVKGVIVREFAQSPSNWRCMQSFESWLEKEKVVGISGLDTRALVRHIRNFGSMNGVISTDGKSSPAQLLEKVRNSPTMEGLNLADEVTTEATYLWNSTCDVEFDKRIKPHQGSPYRVVAIDFGIKRSILDRLVSHGCEVTVVPSNSDISSVLQLSPEGVFFSNGPGDPSAVTGGIALAKQLIEEANDLPLFGICLGHQILGLALGGQTYKLAYGHRGLNHPCGTTGQLEITSQNHGFALDPKSLPEERVEVTHFNLNDKTVAGIAFRNRPIFGIQYHPEASPGPHDADHHFSRFVSLMQERR